MTEATTGTQTSAIDMQELVKEIARALVDKPEAVTVDAVTDDGGTILRLRVAPSDVGKVIGKQGRTARSFRTILGAAGMRLQHRFSLDIIEDEDAPAGESEESKG
jgi:predicted RNA-binding protein YlqC (UPF0109 family)